MFSRFFIDRPIFAVVISLFIALAGLAAMRVLPIAQVSGDRAARGAGSRGVSRSPRPSCSRNPSPRRSRTPSTAWRACYT